MISKNKLITLLKIAACLIFAGRAYQYIAYGAPFRTLLWDQTLLKPVVEEVFNTEWHTYATSKTVDVWIENLTLLNGIILAFAAIACIFINVANKKYLKHIIYLGSFSLMILSALLMKAKFFHNAQFFEHAIQMATPLVLVYAINEKPNFSKISFVLKILIAVTFTCHGLYASYTHQTVLGFSALKGTFQTEDIKKYSSKSNFKIIDDYCLGGYAKIDEEFIRFINEFKANTQISLDPVYTGKMIYGIFDLIKNRKLKENSRILAIHTGGLQGIEGMNLVLKKKNLPQIIY